MDKYRNIKGGQNLKTKYIFWDPEPEIQNHNWMLKLPPHMHTHILQVQILYTFTFCFISSILKSNLYFLFKCRFSSSIFYFYSSRFDIEFLLLLP